MKYHYEVWDESYMFTCRTISEMEEHIERNPHLLVDLEEGNIQVYIAQPLNFVNGKCVEHQPNELIKKVGV